MLERNEIILNRYRKCHELREKGINPFPYRYNATHKSSEVLSKVDELINSKDRVKIAGRVLTVRSFGKTSFFHLQDDKGKIQIYIKEDIVGSEKFKFFAKYLDTGDIINDMMAAGVVEPTSVKIQAIKSSTEAASMILRIDDVIASAKGPDMPMPPGGGMPPGMGGMGGYPGMGGMPPM